MSAGTRPGFGRLCRSAFERGLGRRRAARLRSGPARRRAERRFPFLRGCEARLHAARRELATAYNEYVSTVSTRKMAVSLESAAFLRLVCEGVRPRRILDTGSGFSSFVVRSYALSAPEAEVWSVDDSPEWLERTAAFLREKGLRDDRLMLWDEFRERSSAPYDLIFHDLGRMELRALSLPVVLRRVATSTGLLLLDDVHKPAYAEVVRSVVRQTGCSYFDLTPFTFDAFKRYVALISDVHRIEGV